MKKGNLIGLSLFVGLSLELVSISAMAQTTNNNLVQNGSFEEGYEDTTQINGGWPSNHGFWAPIGYFGATDTIPDWTVSGGGVDWIDSDSSVPNSMIAADGDRSVDLNSLTGAARAGVIWQTIATTPGVSYTLMFSYSGHSYSGCYFGPKRMRASAGSASIVVSADPSAEGYLNSTNIWHDASVSFTATSSSTVISFGSLEKNTCGGPLVDNVRVLTNNLVQNGSFEKGYEDTTQTNGGWPSNHGFWAPIGYFGATDTIPDWTVSAGGVDWQDSDLSVPNSMIAADSDRSVDMNSCCGNTPGVISQTIATTPGVSYTLSFSYSGHPYPFCYFGPKSMRASAGSASTVVSADPLAEGYLNGTNIWHDASVSFTASSPSTVISFESLETDGTCAGPLVDNVWVLAQPPANPVTCPCSGITQFNFILDNLNYCLDLGSSVFASIDPSVRTDITLFREEAGGTLPRANSQCGVLQFGIPGTALTITQEEAAVCIELLRSAIARRGATC